MSEADSTPSRRPPTIDLTAKEVETEPAGSTQDAAAADAANAAGEFGAALFSGVGVSRAGPGPAIQNPATIAPTTTAPATAPTAYGAAPPAKFRPPRPPGAFPVAA